MQKKWIAILIYISIYVFSYGYLTTSHYFEHFLDTVFFVLLAGVLTGSYKNLRKSVA